MKYKIIFLLLFLFSCTTQTSTSKRSASYTAKGFAYILPNNLTPKSLDKETYFISHNKFKIGTKIRIINPDNKKFLELIVKKRIKYDDFYKILIFSIGALFGMSLSSFSVMAFSAINDLFILISFTSIKGKSWSKFNSCIMLSEINIL